MKTFGGLFTIKKFIISIRVTRAMIIGEPRYKVDEFSDLRRFASLTFSVSFCDYVTFQIHFLLEGHKIYPQKAFINLKIRATQKAVYISDTNKFENHSKSSTAHVWGGFLKLKKKLVSENIIMRVTSTFHATPPSKKTKQHRLKCQNLGLSWKCKC